MRGKRGLGIVEQYCKDWRRPRMPSLFEAQGDNKNCSGVANNKTGRQTDKPVSRSDQRWPRYTSAHTQVRTVHAGLMRR